MSENLEAKNKELEKIDEEAFEAIAGGSAKDVANTALAKWKKVPKGLRYATYAAAAIGVAEGADQIIFKGKGTEKVVNLAGTGIKYTGEGIGWVGDHVYDLGEKMANAKIARTNETEDKQP